MFNRRNREWHRASESVSFETGGAPYEERDENRLFVRPLILGCMVSNGEKR